MLDEVSLDLYDLTTDISIFTYTFQSYMSPDSDYSSHPVDTFNLAEDLLIDSSHKYQLSLFGEVGTFRFSKFERVVYAIFHPTNQFLFLLRPNLPLSSCWLLD